MTGHSFSRGHKIIALDNGDWVYEDNKSPINVERPCKRCDKMPTIEGHDACLGHLEGVTSACCGHGTSKPIKLESIEIVATNRTWKEVK